MARPNRRTHEERGRGDLRRRDGALVICLAPIAWGLLGIAGYPSAGWAAAVGCTLLGASYVVIAQRRGLRRMVELRAREVLDPFLAPGARVQIQRWTRGWPGQPRKVKIRSLGRTKTGVSGDRAWAREVADVLSDLAEDGRFVVARHRAVPGEVQLVLDQTPPAATIEPTVDVRRAQRVVTDLLGATAKVEVSETPGQGVTAMEVTHEVGAKLVNVGYRNRVATAVSTMLPGRWRAQWDMENDRVRFELRPQLPDSIWVPPLEPPTEDLLKNYRAVEIPYGVDEDGRTMTWRPAVIPQWIITGGTGSGKTSTAHAIVAYGSQYGWPIWIADGKGVEFLGFQDWPNVQIVASTIEDQVAVIHRAWELMERRYQLVVEGQARSEDFEPLLLFIDEFSDLKGNLLTWYSKVKRKGDLAKPATLSEVGSIARKGRTARVHMVLALQRPDVEFLTGEARDNFGMRTSMGRLSPDGAQMMWGNPGIGSTLPVGRPGRAIGVDAHGVPVEMQCYRTPDPREAVPGSEEARLLDQLRPKTARQKRLLVVPPEPKWVGDDDEFLEPGFWDYADAEWVPAEERPDLDPVAMRKNRDVGEGRALASPEALFGLTGRTPAPRPGAGAGTSSGADGASTDHAAARGSVLELARSGSPATVPDQAADTSVEADSLDELYRSEEPTDAAALRVGDVVLVDEETDLWAVIEDDPLPDVDDQELVVIPWRGDNDTSGELSVPWDAVLRARLPKEGLR